MLLFGGPRIYRPVLLKAEDMLEGLCLLSQAHSERNRPAVARSTVADVLWSLVLPWDGDYEELQGNWALGVQGAIKPQVKMKVSKG